MNTSAPSQLQKFAKDLVSDKNFRTKLKQSPKEAILERLSASDDTWPKGVQIKVVENDRNTINMVVPTLDKDGKLTDSDLDQLAGGEIIFALTLNSTLGLIAVSTVTATVLAATFAAGIALPVLGAEDMLG